MERMILDPDLKLGRGFGEEGAREREGAGVVRSELMRKRERV